MTLMFDLTCMQDINLEFLSLIINFLWLTLPDVPGYNSRVYKLQPLQQVYHFSATINETQIVCL